MTTAAGAGGGFFSDQPFATNIAQPLTTTAGVAGSVIASSVIDCSAFQGARWSFANGGTGVVLIRLSYFDDASAANSVADRWFLLSAGPGGSVANFTLPHLADFLVITLIEQSGVALSVTWSMAQRQNAVAQWNITPQIVLGKPTTPTNVLQLGVNVAMAAGTANLGNSGGCAGIYSGPVHGWFATPLLTGVNVFVQQRDLTNVYQTVAMIRTDAQGNANLDFDIWPMGNGADIRIHTVNGGAASTLSWTITADEYRIGAG